MTLNRGSSNETVNLGSSNETISPSGLNKFVWDLPSSSTHHHSTVVEATMIATGALHSRSLGT